MGTITSMVRAVLDCNGRLTPVQIYDPLTTPRECSDRQQLLLSHLFCHNVGDSDQGPDK